eukprot:TRINITY_DN11418_c0_g1_i1.p1 TRINITY_DN11418_c0_g1~~TRINITY_DN11418_c0_g1_i1.p1  ORF type:complete len:488 (+),score=59.42 TRINITY_DN11418_c0_g1_i1:107-1465(+)
MKSTEEILATYPCSCREKGVHMQEGHMILSGNYLSFYSTVRGRKKKLVFPITDLEKMEKKMYGFFPTAIKFYFRDANNVTEEYFFKSFWGRRDEAFSTIYEHWQKKRLSEASRDLAGRHNEKWIKQLDKLMDQRANRYTIKKKLVVGGFGSTYIVWDKTNFKNYVLKHIICKDDEESEVAMKEVVMLRLLTHPFIVAYSNFWIKKENFFLVMEYCENTDLSKLIESKQDANLVRSQPVFFPLRDVMRWFVQICLALEFLHSQNVLHRDLKPANIFLNRWYDAKLGDFGLSTVRRSSQKSHDIPVGTLGYAAPELLDNKPYDQKCDVYALACTFYEVLTLRNAQNDQDSGIFPTDIPESGYGEDRQPIMQFKKEILAMLATKSSKRPSIEKLLVAPFLKDAKEESVKLGEIYAALQSREAEVEELRMRTERLRLDKYQSGEKLMSEEESEESD